ncbi:MAG: Rpn family recombination-promoting nuclease/putative transposase [Magnetococcales bacterium]|nr:Rpn family recombination-promoting nuclease/putative transposase [Magnetococcales bacterium]
MTELAQPHDRLFKALMSHSETAGALLREYLPKEIVALLAPGPPELMPGSFVSQELRPYYSDRLFRAKTLSGKSLFFYTLMEHKSYPDRKVAWQLFFGCSRFMEQQDRENPEWTLLPAIIPFILYHGSQEWKIPKEFAALIDADDVLRPWLVNFPFTVVDLGPIPNDQLACHARLKVGLLALKYGTRAPKEQMEALDLIASALMEAPELLIEVMLYLLTTFQSLDESTVHEIVVRVCPQETIEMISVFAREIVEQHKHAWLQEGKADMLLHLLQRRFGVVSDAVQKRVVSANLKELETWTDRIFDADSIQTVLQ